MQQEKNKT